MEAMRIANITAGPWCFASYGSSCNCTEINTVFGRFNRGEKGGMELTGALEMIMIKRINGYCLLGGNAGIAQRRKIGYEYFHDRN